MISAKKGGNEMHVSELTIGLIIFNMVLGLLFPVFLAVWIHKKYHVTMRIFWIGFLMMFVFARTLEQIAHSVILSTPAGMQIQNNLIYMALYGGLMAGIFEECGRLVGMKYFMKKIPQRKENALMYAAGHGGFEMMFLLILGMVNNLIYSILLNLGKADVLLAPLDEAGKAAVQAGFEALSNANPLLFLASPLERFAALIAQFGLSVIVWYGVIYKKKMLWLFVAILLHMLLDSVAVILNGIGLPVLGTELVVWAMAIGIVFVAVKLWKQMELD